MKKLLRHLQKFYWLILIVIIVSCRGRGGINNPGYVQPSYSYSTYSGGYGTDYYSGAALFIISQLDGYSEGFNVTVSGAGSYTLAPGVNQIQFNYLLPGSYPFTVTTVSGYSASPNAGYYISGYVTVYQGSTTQVNVYTE